MQRVAITFRRIAAALLASASLVVLIYACFRLQLDLTTTALLALIAIMLVSLTGSLASSVAASIAATLSLNYWLVPPTFAMVWDDPVDIVSLFTFLSTALVITHLLSRVRQSLREAQAARDELRVAIDTIPALVWTTLPDGSGDFNNLRWLEYTGLSREQAKDWGYKAALHPEDYERLLPDWGGRFSAGQAIADEARLRRADGVYRWFMHRAVPLRDQVGNIIKWYGTSSDIEDERRAVDKLREQARLLDLTHDTVFVRDLHDVITYWNRGAEELYGWTSDEVLGQVTHTLLHTVFPLPFQEITATLLETGRWEGELVHTRRDGTRVVVASRWSLRRDAEGRPIGTLETNNDISERKRAEAALRRSRAYLAEAQRLSRTGSVGWKPASDELLWSDETFRIFGYDRATMTPSVDHTLRRIHPEDRAQVEQLIERTRREAKDWETDYRLLMPDGALKYVHVVAHATQDDDDALEYVGAIMDVTAARRAEEELRRSEAYLAEAQRLSHTGSWARSLRHPEQWYASAEIYRIFDLDPSAGVDLTKDLFRDRVHPDDRAELQRAWEAAVRAKSEIEAECRALRPDGSIRHVYLVGHSVVGADGEVDELVGTLMDVTDRKVADQALRRARERALKARFEAVLDERTRLAREIHDTLLQGFTGVALKLVAASSRYSGSPDAAAALQDVVTLAQKTLVDARQAVWDLRSPSLVGGEVVTELRTLAEDGVRGVGLRLEFEVTGTPRPLAPEVRAVACRVVQEAVTNVVKHAAATAVRVRLSFGARGLRLSVKDDGRGFTADPNFQGYGGHWGLLGMRERAARVRGKLSVRSASGQGTELVLLVPYAARGERSPVPAGAPPA